MKKNHRKQYKNHPIATPGKKEGSATEEAVRRHFFALIKQLRNSRHSCEIDQIKTELAHLTFES
jgi:hypothetical protein